MGDTLRKAAYFITMETVDSNHHLAPAAQNLKKESFGLGKMSSRRQHIRRSGQGRRYHEMKNFKHSRESISSGQAQALWTFLIGVAVAFLALWKLAGPDTSLDPVTQTKMVEAPEILSSDVNKLQSRPERLPNSI